MEVEMKYIKPTIEYTNLEAADIIMASRPAVTYEALEGYDEGDSKSAVFNADFWLH